MELPGQVKGLLEHGAFWEELCRASPPEVLAHLGSMLCICSTLDERVDTAVRRAAERAAGRQVGRGALLGGQGGRASPCTAQPAFGTGSEGGGAVERARPWCLTAQASWDLVRADDKSDDSDENDSEGREDEGFEGFEAVPDGESEGSAPKPYPLLAQLLPGFGSCVSRNIWLGILALCACYRILEIFHHQHYEVQISWTQVGRCFLQGGRLLDMLLCFPLLVGIHRMAHYQAIRAALSGRRGGTTSRRVLRVLLRRCLALAWGLVAVYFLVTVSFGVLPGGGFLHRLITSFGGTRVERLWAAGDVVCWLVWCLHVSAFLPVFGLAWKMSWIELVRFCSGLEGVGATDWAMLLESYDGVHEYLHDIWGPKCAALATSVFFWLLLVNMVRFYIEGVSASYAGMSFYCYVWASLSASVLITVLFMTAQISVKCASRRIPDNSILLVALQRAGRVPREERVNHGIFLFCVVQRPLGIQISGLGNVKIKLFYYILRLLSVALPALVGISVAVKAK